MSTDASRPPALATCVTILLSITRVFVLGYIALAVFSFLETRQLLVQSSDNSETGYYDVKDGTLYVSLVLCLPGSLTIAGTVVATDTTTAQCRELDYLIASCGSSLLLSAAAALFWLITDLEARCNRSCGPLNRHTAAGMGLFLIFLLAQAGISIGALVEQLKFWVDYFDAILDELNNAAGSDSLTDVKSYANLTYLLTTAIAAFVTCLILLIDAIVYSCLYKPQKTRHDSLVADQQSAQIAMEQQAMAIENAAQLKPSITTSTSIESGGTNDEKETVSNISPPSIGVTPSGGTSSQTPSWSVY